MDNLLPNAAIDSVLAAQTAGQGTDQTTGVDMAGYTSVIFITTAVTVVSGGSVTISVEGRDDSGESWTALEGGVTRAEAGVIGLEVHAPMKRFVRAVVVRADQNVTLDSTLAIRRLATDNPVEHADQTVAVLVSPDPVT